jgi:hypothetical protein
MRVAADRHMRFGSVSDRTEGLRPSHRTDDVLLLPMALSDRVYARPLHTPTCGIV